MECSRNTGGAKIIKAVNYKEENMKIVLGSFFGVVGLVGVVIALCLLIPGNQLRRTADPLLLLPMGVGLSFLTSYYLLKEPQ